MHFSLSHLYTIMNENEWMSEVISPFSIYMISKGSQQYICGPIPLQETYDNHM
jgi:hypothetical protein